MNLEPLDLVAVQKSLEPHVSPRALAMVRTADERALLVEIEEGSNYRKFLLELSVETWNRHVRLEKEMRPLLTICKALKWVGGSASGIAAAYGAFQKWKGHKT